MLEPVVSCPYSRPLGILPSAIQWTLPRPAAESALLQQGEYVRDHLDKNEVLRVDDVVAPCDIEDARQNVWSTYGAPLDAWPV